MEKVGLRGVTYRRLGLGTVTVHTGHRVRRVAYHSGLEYSSYTRRTTRICWARPSFCSSVTMSPG